MRYQNEVWKNQEGDNVTVKHIFSGKRHFFEVPGTKEVHSIILEVNCTCRDFTIIKCAKAGFCKHILEVMRYINENQKFGYLETKERMSEISEGEQQEDKSTQMG